MIPATLAETPLTVPPPELEVAAPPLIIKQLAPLGLYETQKYLGEYLLFHYGTAEEILPYATGPRDGLDFPVRVVRDCLSLSELPARARALDLGCAVGRSSFELARVCQEVVGIDYSQRFIDAARELGSEGWLDYERVDEGELSTQLIARVPGEIARDRVRFERGDAHELRADLGTFDVILMANLIDRLRNPIRCLLQLSTLINPGGQIIITSPYTWLTDFTPRDNWLGGFDYEGENVRTLQGLHAMLDTHFDLVGTRDLPMLIREHARKFQWSVAQASIWRRP